MYWGSLWVLALLQVIGFSLAFRDEQFLMDQNHPMINEELTSRGLLLNRNKRTPVLGIWYKPRRSRTKLENTRSTKPYTATSTMEEKVEPKGNIQFWILYMTPSKIFVPLDKNELEIIDLNMTIRKLQMWDATLIRKYADRFKANKESLTENPIWQKVRKKEKNHLKPNPIQFSADEITKIDSQINESVQGKNKPT